MAPKEVNNSTINSIVNSGVYRFTGAYAIGNKYITGIIVFAFDNSQGTVVQIAVDDRIATNEYMELYHRKRRNGEWSNWYALSATKVG